MLDRGLTDARGRGLTWCTHTWDVGGRAIAVQPGRRSDRPGLPLPFGSPGLPIYLPIYIPSSFIYIYIYIHTHRIPAQSFSSWSDPLLSCPLDRDLLYRISALPVSGPTQPVFLLVQLIAQPTPVPRSSQQNIGSASFSSGPHWRIYIFIYMTYWVFEYIRANS
jgi:hypothetical protein